jgi:hypothetical protein
MTAITHPAPTPTPTRTRSVTVADGAPTIALKRRTIDSVLIGLGAVVALVLMASGALLTWGANFSNDYVHDELAAQNITFPDAATLTEEGRTDLLGHAGATVDTGIEGEAYASFIGGHLAAIADGATYAELGTPERAAAAAVTEAKASGATDAEIAALQGDADKVTGQRNSLFKGETLRGLLLSAFAWSTVGRIAGIASVLAFAAAGIMVLLVLFGLRHHHKIVAAQ